MRGITLTELLVVIGILVVLSSIAIPVFLTFYQESDLSNAGQELVSGLKVARSKTLAAEAASRWGVYFSTSTQQHILFSGETYATRDSSFDKATNLPKSVEFYQVNLAGTNQEVVFERLTGKTQNLGSVSLRLKKDHSKTQSLHIQSSGKVTLFPQAMPTDEGRLKDSRHVHFDYSRPIATSIEDILLTFDGAVTETIVVADNLNDNQISWQGEVIVGGETQHLEIITHSLNDPSQGTQFSIYRDGRRNSKSLTIEISDSPDPDVGTLVSYTAQGEVSLGTSVYASNLQTQ